MTEHMNTSERQSGDPMDSDSETGDIRPDPKRRRTRRRRWYLLAVTPALILTLAACGVLRQGPCHMGGVTPADSGVTFALSRLDLSPVLAHAAMPVHVRACVRDRYSTLRFAEPKPTSSCVSLTFDQRGPAFSVDGQGTDLDLDPWSPPDVLYIKDPPVTWEVPIAVRLNVSWANDSVFDSSAVVQPYKLEPNGPGCEPSMYTAQVVATRSGHLVPYKAWEPNA